MRIDIDLIALVCSLFVGWIALGANHSRLINRLFFVLSLLTAAWLGARRSAIAGGDVVFWIRLTNSVGAFVPAIFALLRYSVLHEKDSAESALRSNWVWVLYSTFLALITFSHSFIPPGSTSLTPQWGRGYYFYLASVGLLFISLFALTILDVRRSSGVKKIELQLLLLGGCGSAAIILGLMLLKRISGSVALARADLQPLVAMGFYAVVVYAMTSHRILDAAQIVSVLAKKAAVVVIACVVFVVSRWLLDKSLSEALLIFISIVCVLWVSGHAEEFLERRVRFFSPKARVRELFYEAAKQESNADDLYGRFKIALKEWASTEEVLIIGIPKSLGTGFDVPVDSKVMSVLRGMKWVTPERLSREKGSVGRETLGLFLVENKLGALVVAEGPSFLTLVGVGMGSSLRPYTYPQVLELMELAAIMESALERAHFAAKVQRTEQLATVGMVGASLAHEIRNPLVSIKTFVQLLPTHYADPAFREKFFRLIGDEVARIDELTQQLLDLAAPRSYQAALVGLHGVLRPGLELVEARAAERGVRVEVAFAAEPDVVFTDAAAAKQVLLNLCFNAIQAVESKGGPDRWVRLSTRRVGDVVELAVSDSGPGIAPEMQRRLFQPFQTTKSRGFGLGLAICRDILANVRATIAVDPAVPGQGATFRVTFPCQAQSS